MKTKYTQVGLVRGVRLVAAAAFVLIAGCKTAPKSTVPHTFFPAPPDEPRLQYLTSFAQENDLGHEGSFTEFVVGRDKVTKPIIKPYGIETSPGKIYVCDTQIGAVEVVDLAKKRMTYFRPAGEATLGVPINIAVDTDGTRYITDTQRGQVLIFSATENYLGAIGTKDELKPTGVALSKDRIYVTDLKNHNVRVYSKADRKLLFAIPRDPKDEKAKLFSPTNIALDEQGNVYISDTGAFAVQIFDGEGQHRKTIGEEGLAPGQLALCKGLALDRQGRLYVVDAKTQLVQLFDNEGRLLMFFGDSSGASATTMGLPAGIAVDYDNVKYFQKYAAPDFKIEYLVFVTNQTGREKVAVFGFGHKK